ncbi:hypothetical protein BBO01nite_36370 [Brevibacillus borstelensis]|jgi:hypothetical protein|nr:hypothetical protein BBO01nite_36370 [Brevibacillus borstelensis]
MMRSVALFSTAGEGSDPLLFGYNQIHINRYRQRTNENTANKDPDDQLIIPIFTIAHKSSP